MYATNGELIEAHGGQITKWGDTYYWYGEDRSQGYYSVGVHLYTSKDLYHWEDKGLVMKMMSSIDQFTEDPYFGSLYGDLDEEAQQEIFKHLQHKKASEAYCQPDTEALSGHRLYDQAAWLSWRSASDCYWSSLPVYAPPY